MRVGFVSLGMSSQPLDQVLQLGAEADAEVMELNGRETVHQGLWAKPIDYAGIKAKLRAGGPVASSLGGYSDFAQSSDEELAEQVEQFVGYCAVAREMGIPIVRAFAGDVVPGHSLDEFYPKLVAGFKGVTERIAQWGLKVGIENHGRLINNGDQLKSLIEDVGSPLLGMTIDTGNFCWAGHSVDTAHRFFDELAPLTVNVHIKDGTFKDGEFVLLPAGRGDIDIAGLMATLAANGYDGAIVSEYEGKGDFRASTIESVAYLKGVRDGLAATTRRTR